MISHVFQVQILVLSHDRNHTRQMIIYACSDLDGHTNYCPIIILWYNGHDHLDFLYGATPIPPSAPISSSSARSPGASSRCGMITTSPTSGTPDLNTLHYLRL